jgi:probable HAF family extracellular repeat protein
VKLEIDPDIIDAEVAHPATGTKIYTYNYDTFTPTGNWYNAAYSINNIGATGSYGGFINGRASDVGGEVGQTLTLEESISSGGGVSGWGYSILDWGTPLDIIPPAYTQSLGVFFGTGRVCYCTQMLGMNNAGWIAGYWNDYNSLNHGFLNQGGTLSSFDAPGAAGGIGTFATAINDAGLVVGYYYDSSYNTHGFLYNANTQQFIAAPLDYPGGSYSQLNGINGDAQIVGEYYDGANYQGFLYSNGTFTSTSGTCGPERVPLGINNNGQMVGNGFVSYDGGLSCSAFAEPAAGGD